MKAKQLHNLLARGRVLHWRNHVTLAVRVFGKKPGGWPEHAPPLVDFVYRGAQFVMAADLMSRRAYLDDAALGAFATQLFELLAGPNGDRFHTLTGGYAESFDDADGFPRMLARDLCAAMMGETSAAGVAAFEGSPRAILRMTQLYTAQVFNDRELVKKLS